MDEDHRKITGAHKKDEASSSGVRTALYRHYGPERKLLYVGVSLNAVARLAQHKNYSQWFGDIRRVTVEWFDSREEALAAERAAVAAEKPFYNKNLKRHTAPSPPEPPQARSEEDRLVWRVVGLRPIMSPHEVADALNMPVGEVKRMQEDHKIGSIDIGKRWTCRRTKEKRVRLYTTGWQVLSYIESIGGFKAP